jgi:DmsE family decaheme c-type cytochrome
LLFAESYDFSLGNAAFHIAAIRGETMLHNPSKDLLSGIHASFLSPAAVFIFLLFLLFLPRLRASTQKVASKQSPATAQHADASQYVGSETCALCHAGIVHSLEQTPHWKMTLKGIPNGAPDNCEGCHGPGKAHVDSGGDVTKIFRFTTATPEQASQRCLACHLNSHHRYNYARSAHAEAKVGCLSCHSVHHPASQTTLLLASQPTLCYSCHANIKTYFDRPFHHRVNEGLMKCTDCHNPHGTFRDTQLRTAATQDQVCIKCHIENAGPFVYEHPPVKTEGCVFCHNPHGSSNPRMLNVNNVNTLCLQCHTDTMNFTAPGTPSFHNQANQFQACTLCHVTIHGSNASPVFFQ